MSFNRAAIEALDYHYHSPLRAGDKGSDYVGWFGGRERIHLSPRGEKGHAESIRRLANIRPVRLFIGCAGLVNLQYIAALEAEHAVLVDINENQTSFMRHVLDVIAEAKSKEEAADRIVGLIRRAEERDTSLDVHYQGISLFKGKAVAEIAAIRRMQTEGTPNWLNDDQLFLRLQSRIRAQALAVVTGDLADPSFMRDLATSLGGALADVIYSSNVALFMEMPARERMLHNFHLIAQPDTQILDVKEFHGMVQSAPLRDYAFTPLSYDQAIRAVSIAR